MRFKLKLSDHTITYVIIISYMNYNFINIWIFLFHFSNNYFLNSFRLSKWPVNFNWIFLVFVQTFPQFQIVFFLFYSSCSESTSKQSTYNFPVLLIFYLIYKDNCCFLSRSASFYFWIIFFFKSHYINNYYLI